MRFIDLEILDQKKTEVEKWKRGVKSRCKTLVSKTTHQERARYLALVAILINKNRF